MIHPALLHIPTPNWAAMAWSMPYGWYEPPPPPDLSDLPPPGRYHLDPARSSVRAKVRCQRWSDWRRWQAGAAGVTGSLRFGRGSAAVDLAVETAGLRKRRPGARPDAARPARPALEPAAALHRHRTGGGARRVARARPGHPARPGRARRAVDRPGRPAARRHDHHRPARNAGAPGERVRPGGRTGAHAGRGPGTGVVRAAVRRRCPARASEPHRRLSLAAWTSEVPVSTGAAGRAATGPGSAADPRAWHRVPCGPPAPAAGPPCRRPPATSARTPRWAA